MSPQELKTALGHGLLSFPLTDFDANLAVASKPFADRLEWLQAGLKSPFVRPALSQPTAHEARRQP